MVTPPKQKVCYKGFPEGVSKGRRDLGSGGAVSREASVTLTMGMPYIPWGQGTELLRGTPSTTAANPWGGGGGDHHQGWGRSRILPRFWLGGNFGPQTG